MQGPTKAQPCLRCGTKTNQTLVPSSEGASWKCDDCGNELIGYTREDMLEIVATKVFGLPKKPEPIEVPKNLKVFLKYYGDDTDEMEAARHSVEAHVMITGKLPEAGKPMFAKAGAHPLMAIPYGEVIRVERS